jgi:pimeloyl-ACP methyl ester carboxylesterase
MSDDSNATGSASDTPADYEIEIFEVRQGSAEGSYYPLTFVTSRGEVGCQYYAVPNASKAVIWVGGVGGGFDSPANQLYPRLAHDLQAEGIASLRVCYRRITELEECVLDVLAGLDWLANGGVERLALVGHSLGGAVVIQAGTASDRVRGVVTLATQSYGADAVMELRPQCGILLVHGRDDQVLSLQSSEFVFQMAHEPRKLVLYDGAGHGLDEVAVEVERVVYAWLRERLG